jgi:hypothetical protein
LHEEIASQVGATDKTVTRMMAGVRMVALLVAGAGAMMGWAAMSATTAKSDVQVLRAENAEFKRMLFREMQLAKEDRQEIKDNIKALRGGS